MICPYYIERVEYKEFKENFIKSKKVFWKYIKWHQKIVFALLRLNNKKIDGWLVANDFAPGKKGEKDLALE